MTEIDNPGVMNWYARYKEKARPWMRTMLAEQTDITDEDLNAMLDWQKVDSLIPDPLKAYYLFVFGFCLPDAMDLE